MKTLEKQKAYIMRRIYTIWLLRGVLHSPATKVVLLLLFAWQLTASVSVQNVWVNWQQFGADLGASITFLQSAFLHTELSTQLILLAMIAFVGLLARDILLKWKSLDRREAFVRA